MPTTIRTALISVTDKNGLVDFARALIKRNIRLLATSGTASILRENNITVVEVSEYTQFPEIMSGRVKTLHPKLFAGLLWRPEQDEATLKEHEIDPIDMIIINLYPFQTVTSRPDCHLSTAIENIDIGGPSMIRAAAKNFANVTVIVNSDDYGQVLSHLEQHDGKITETFRFEMAQKAFAYTAHYEAAISNFLGSFEDEHTRSTFPKVINTQLVKKSDLRYGENPQQQAAFYLDYAPGMGTLADSRQLQGKELSFNNLADADTAWECVQALKGNSCVIVKHANPCGAATANSLKEAYLAAFGTDSESAFGGIIAMNQEVCQDTAMLILEKQFAEVIIAPGFTQEALDVFASKDKLRLLSCPPKTAEQVGPYLDFKRVGGGMLVQHVDNTQLDKNEIQVVSNVKPSESTFNDLLFAWQIVRMVKSNAIVFARDHATIGIGAGQMSRIFSAYIATVKAQHANLSLHNSVMASDAFLPFPDTVELAAKEGVIAIIQPGGSIRDNEVIDAANAAGIAMLFTGVRHFRH